MMVFTQLRSGTAGAAQDDAHFAALRRDLDAESGHTRIPVDYIRVWRPQRVDDTLGQFDARHRKRTMSGGATFASHRQYLQMKWQERT